MSGRFRLERDAARALTPPRPVSKVDPEPGCMGPELAYMDASQLWLRDTFRGPRLLLCALVLVLATLPLGLWFWSLSADRAAQEAEMLGLLDDELSAFGDAYIDNLIEGGDRTLPLIWPDRKLSYVEYLYYAGVLSPGGWRVLLLMTLFALVALMAGLAGIYWLLRQSPNGPLIFDRARQAVFISRRDELLAAPWEKLFYVQRAWQFGWLLFDETEASQLVEVRLPTDRLGVLSQSAGEALLARIAAFMADGPDAITSTQGDIDAPPVLPEGVLSAVDERLKRLRA